MRLSQAPVSSSRPHTLPLGEMRFVAAGRVPHLCVDLADRKFLVVGAPGGPLAPSGLRRRIDDAVEGELAARGALPAAIGVDAELASCIRDQVFRARALGTTGLAIALPPLHEMTDGEGRMNVDDSAALLAWTRATAELPVVLLASDADRSVTAYAPMPLERLLLAEGRAAPAELPPVVDEATWLEASREPSDPFDMTPPAPAVSLSRDVAPPSARDAAPLSGRPRGTPAPPAVRTRTTPPPPPVVQVAAPRAMVPEAPRAVVPSAPRVPSALLGDIPDDMPAANFEASLGARNDSTGGEPAPRRLKSGMLKGTKPRASVPPPRPVEIAPAPQSSADAGVHDIFSAEPVREAPQLSLREPAPVAFVTRQEEPAPEPASIPVRVRDAGAARAVNSAEWRSLAMELDAARGPKPVRQIEQLFMTKYVPLLGALARNEADGAVRNIVEGWAQAFEHSYVDSFSAMRVTGKRPLMTFDAPEIATRLARLNGARGVKLLLVDAMSFDLGERVSAELRARASASGVCVERMLLWSALPTTTAMQLALLSRGPDALRDVEPPSEPEPEIARGRAVGTLRRERLGAREVMKLDLAEARLRTAGAGYDDRLDAVADEVAAVVSRYLESLPQRTLVLVFGDHGFRLPKSPDGRATGPAVYGGATPEEVLVPAYAWLTGGVH